MIKLCIVAVVGLLVVQLCAGYTTKYDNIDLDEIIANDRLFTTYYNCLLDKGKCSPEAEELKAYIPDALATDCAQCSEKQKEGSKKMLKYVLEKRPEEYAELEKKYDPNGTYKIKYQKLIDDIKAGKV
uniref:Ejaculatory bulb-specific protein 3 n=1 Tax=Cacopsylla melanoneura TaxID=428564 RepID=A0A8D9E7L9_9HEMI